MLQNIVIIQVEFFEERNGKLFQIENGIYKPVSNISGLKETEKIQNIILQVWLS